jgi:hypothetical protein
VTLDSTLVTINGAVPKVAGDWKVIAVIDRDWHTGIGTYQFLAEGVELPDDGTSEHCNHCEKKRRRRKIFYIQNEQGDIQTIGGTCIKDFFPGTTLEGMLACAEFGSLDALLRDDERLDFDWLVKGTKYHELKDVLRTSVYLCKQMGGYLSRERAEKQGRNSTAWEVRETLSFDYMRAKVQQEITVAQLRKADAVLAWLRGLDQSQYTQSYMLNLWSLGKAELVADKHVGILASAVAAYDRAMAEERRAEMAGQSDHVGTIGTRAEFDVVIESTRCVQSYYGDKVLYNFRTESGDLLIWWCTGSRLQAKDNTPIRIKGTVKKHTSFRDENQTQLNRVTLVA